MKRVSTILALTLSLALVAAPAFAAVDEWAINPDAQVQAQQYYPVQTRDEWNINKMGPDFSGAKGMVPAEELQASQTDEWLPEADF